jgi:hypothetical protein
MEVLGLELMYEILERFPTLGFGKLAGKDMGRKRIALRC